MEPTSREKILKKIRKALIHHRPNPHPSLDWEKNVHVQSNTTLEETFAHAFGAIGGHFVFCVDEQDLTYQLSALISANKISPLICTESKIGGILSKAGISFVKESKDFPEGMGSVTSCDALVSRLGVVLASSKSQSGRKLIVVPTTHIVIAYTSQLVPDLKDAFELIRKKYKQLPSQIVSIAGPSRTADIEKTLVTPAHGPKDIFVFLIDSPVERVKGDV